MTVTDFPHRGPARGERLLEVVRGLDTASMSTPEVIDAVVTEVPDATPDEMIAALRQVAEEHTREADEMQAVREHLAPFWRQHPEMTLGEAINAMAEQGDERCIAWRDWLAH